jgi:hypothetical protein
LGAIDFTRYKEYIINVQGNKPGYAKLQTDLMGIEKTLSKHEVVTDTAQAYYSLGNKSTTPPYYRAMVPGSVGRQQRYGVVSSSRSPYQTSTQVRDSTSTTGRPPHKDIRSIICHNCGGMGHISIDCKAPKYNCGVCGEDGHREWFCGRFQKPPGQGRKRSRFGSPTPNGPSTFQQRQRVNHIQDEFYETLDDEPSANHLDYKVMSSKDEDADLEFEEALFARPYINRDKSTSRTYHDEQDDYSFFSNE